MSRYVINKNWDEVSIAQLYKYSKKSNSLPTGIMWTKATKKNPLGYPCWSLILELSDDLVECYYTPIYKAKQDMVMAKRYDKFARGKTVPQVLKNSMRQIGESIGDIYRSLIPEREK